MGGTERIAVRLAGRWAALGRDVTLLCGDASGRLAQLIAPEVRVVACEPPIRRGRGARRRFGREVGAWIAAHRPDVLFVPGNYQWPAVEGVRAPGTAIIAQIGTPLFRHGRGPLAQVAYNWRTRRQLRTLDAAVCLAQATVAQADRVLGRRITRAIPLPALEDDAAPPTRAEGRTILAAGRLVPEKGFDQAIRAFARLGDPAARLTIVGEGPELAKLTALAAQLGVADRVAFPGYVSDIGPWLAQARVFLLSSWYEGYGAVVIEALAAGRPVVATDCTPAAAELLGKAERGRVVPLGDVGALAAALQAVLAAPAPEPETLAAAVDGFRLGPIARAYLDLFDELAARQPDVSVS